MAKQLMMSSITSSGICLSGTLYRQTKTRHSYNQETIIINHLTVIQFAELGNFYNYMNTIKSKYNELITHVIQYNFFLESFTFFSFVCCHSTDSG